MAHGVLHRPRPHGRRHRCTLSRPPIISGVQGKSRRIWERRQALLHPMRPTPKCPPLPYRRKSCTRQWALCRRLCMRVVRELPLTPDLPYDFSPAQDDPLTTSIKPTSAMYRISEATETSTQVRSTPLDAGSGPQWERAWPDVPQDELPLRRVFDATFPDTPTPVQTQATRVTLSKACPRLVRGPVYK